MSQRCFTEIFFGGLIIINGGCNQRCVGEWCENISKALRLVRPATRNNLRGTEKKPTKNEVEKAWYSSFRGKTGISLVSQRLLSKEAERYSGNMDLWGPAVWQALHNISIFFEPQLFENFRYGFLCLAYVLPCVICRLHVKRHILIKRELLHTKTDFINFVINLHNTVTKSKYDRSIAIIYPQLSASVFTNDTLVLENLVANHGRSKTTP